MRRLLMATMVFFFGLAVGLGGPALAGHVFSDVGDDDTHASGIHWAAERNLVKGYDDGTYRPGQAVTRGQLATILERQNAPMGPEYSLTPICGSLDLQIVDHNRVGSGAATVQYSIDGGDRTEIIGPIPEDGSPLLFEADGPGVVTLFVDSLAWASVPTSETCTPEG